MLKVISVKDCLFWDEIVKSFQNYDVNYLSNYAKSAQIIDEGEALLVYIEKFNTRAINVVIKRDISNLSYFKNKIPENQYFDLSTPYGYGGFWIEGDEISFVEKSYKEYCLDNGFISEFVRFHLLSGHQNFYDGYTESLTNNVIRALDIPIDEILIDFEYKVRKNIRKANKSGLEIVMDYSGDRINEFLKIYYSTMIRNKANSLFMFPEEFFKTINKLNGNFAYFYVSYKGIFISTELVLYGTENCYSFLGGTNPDYFPLRPNDFIKFEIIKWAKEKGLKRFILGGGYGSNDGIYNYKKSFAPNGVTEFYIGKRIFDNDKYNKLLELRKNADNMFNSETNFFPKYRG